MRVAITSLLLTIGCSGAEVVVAPSDGGVAEVDAGSAPRDAGPAARASEWGEVSSTPNAEGRWGAHMVYLEEARRFLLFGGTRYPMGGALGDLWSYAIDDDAWTMLPAGGNQPPPRYCYCLTYLPTTNEVLLVGGRDSGGPLAPAAYVLDVDALEWTQVQGTVPPGVIGCAAEWMPSIDRAIVFGGGTARDLPTATFAYDPAAQTFTEVATSTAPPGRADPASAYDAERGRMLVFGGGVSAVPPYAHLDDTWAFDGTDWSKIDAAGPSARRFPAGAVDPVARAWFVFSGTRETEDPADLWRFDLDTDTWTRLDADDAPGPRGFAAAAWDPITEAMFVFGGFTQPVVRAKADGWRFVTPR